MENNLFFSKDHIWVQKNNDTVKIGLSDFAQKKMKAVVFINLPEEGDSVTIGEAFGDIESLKTVSDLISPVDGVVTAVNADIADDPQIINEQPYESWLIEVNAANLSDELMDEGTYTAFTEKE